MKQLSEINLSDFRENLQKGRSYLRHNEATRVKLAIDIQEEGLLELLDEFIQEYEAKSIRAPYVKLFLKGFKASIEGARENVNAFSEKLFYKQYEYYKALDTVLIQEGILYSNKNTIQVLVDFYRFLGSSSIKEKHSFVFNQLFIDSINSKTFYKYYEQGYIFTYYQRGSKLPQGDKWCIIPSSLDVANADSGNLLRKTFDFTQCNNRDREEVKKFVWINLRKPSTLNHISRLIEFLNDMDDEENKFNDMALWEYRVCIKEEVSNTGNIKSIFKIVRKYLDYYKEIYEDVIIDKDILSLAGLDNYDGGTVIEKHDFDLIYNEFKKMEIENQKFKIYTLMLEFFRTTKFRMGTIINLERNCLIKNNDGSYTLQYRAKTSEELKREKISEESAKMLMDAIKETKDIALLEGIAKNYIFIEPYKAQHITRSKRIAFQGEFRKVLKRLGDCLSRQDYTCNNIRHTFIDEINRTGIKMGLTLSKIALLTGDSTRVVNRHYRDKRQRVTDYLEVTYKMIISNVNIMGEILNNQDSSNGREVRVGLGQCSKKGCTFAIGECLRCPNFITFSDRKNKFYEMLNYLEQQIQEETEEEILEELQAQKELVGIYIVEMEAREER